MSAPDLTFTVEPGDVLWNLDNLSVVCGWLAAPTSNDPSNSQLSLVLTITNNEPFSVGLNKVTVSFVGPPNVSPQSISIVPSVPIPSTGPSTAPTIWSLAGVDATNNIILPVPPPVVVQLSLYCDGFSDPAYKEVPLTLYVNPAAEGGYSFPSKTADLKHGEYWTGLSANHLSGGGTQDFAYDLEVYAYDPSTKQWSRTRPAADPSKNESYYIWGKPVYAIADGVVVSFQDGIPPNTPPGFPSPSSNPVEGNHFYIQHGIDLALYAHFQAGTLNPALTSGPNPDGTGAPVVEGQLLGLAGNSGHASWPHLHIHVDRATKPWEGPFTRPLPFNDIYVLDLTKVDPKTWPPNSDKPWNAVPALCLPNVRSAIWPGALRQGRIRYYRAPAWAGIMGALAWAWLIIVGGLMFTPLGPACIGCSPSLSMPVSTLIGGVSIALGVVGFASLAVANRAAARQRVARPQIDTPGDLHG
jgi:hypothetical protein